MDSFPSQADVKANRHQAVAPKTITRTFSTNSASQSSSRPRPRKTSLTTKFSTREKIAIAWGMITSVILLVLFLRKSPPAISPEETASAKEEINVSPPDLIGDSDYEEAKPITLTDNNDGTVTDLLTKLMWQKEDDNKVRNWNDSINYCKGLSLGGFNNWRLPEREELESIIDKNRKDPALDTLFFPDTNSSPFWSFTTDVGSSSEAWIVDFYLGNVDFYEKTYNYFVRCVR